MNITLYKYSHELNLMDKGSYLLEPLVLTNVILKDNTSIVKPILRIANLGLDGNAQLDYNYLYISEFNRYYFVDNIVSINNTLFDIYCIEDVLYTYRTELLALPAYVARNEHEYNISIRDELAPFKYGKLVNFYNITNLSTVDSFNTNLSASERNFLLVCTSHYYGGAITHRGQPIVNASSAAGNTVSAECLGTYGDQGYFVGTSLLYEYTKAFTLNDQNLASYIKFMIAYPFELPRRLENDTPVSEYIWLGDTELRDTDIVNPSVQFNILEKTHLKLKIADFTFSNEYASKYFLNYEPYSTYEIFLPYYGYVKISASSLLNKRLVVYYEIDVTNGSAIITIQDYANSKTIWSSQCQIGSRVSIDSTNLYENDTRRQNIALTSSIGFLTSGLALALSGGNPIGISASIAGMASSLGSGIARSNTLFDSANVNVASGNDGLFLEQNVFIKVTSSAVVDDLDHYASLIGRPLEKVVYLNTLNGYTVIKDIHLSNIKATSTEKEMLLQILKGGFIRES